MLIWMRSTLAEILYPEMGATEIVHDTCPLKCISVTDCKSLCDTITKEKISMTDRRLSLEAAILRQSLEEVTIKWVKSDQMLADCLTTRGLREEDRDIKFVDSWA